ncbi:MAG: 2-C-methyl-D-erythritol 4-phosphate cytidylyltransferase [Phycisphaerales bacterium]|jgi:2-C-methyl-D-erythritol 4-phosphate cytidylyltransferase|nr:2-C-methyl-D-erythritol 4-phosphate cytidylyltransferase [Phycisphaerales bacterium]
MNVTAIVPAAGASTRFGRDKLGQDLGGRPVLVRTVEALTRREEIRHIIVAAPPNQLEPFKERFGPVLGFHGARIVPGSEVDRWDTVRSALAHVPAESTHIAVHDAARPCVGEALFDRLFEAAASLDAVVPAISVTSTIKEVDASSGIDVAEADLLADAILGAAGSPTLEARQVRRTVSRAGLVLAQTPQVFAAGVLEAAFAGAPEGATDEAEVVERAGQPVYVLDGDPLNIKVTLREDLPLAAAILRAAGEL